MILDRLANADLYAPIGRRIAHGLDYLRQTNFDEMEPGRYEIDGAAVYAVVSAYSTRDVAAGRWEAHRRYIDLQYIVRGTERIGFAPIERLKAEPYDDEKDLLWLSGAGEFVTLEAGDFMILWPHDAHMPGIATGAPAPIRKVVVKFATDGR